MEADLFENLKILLLKLNQILAIQKSLKHKPTRQTGIQTIVDS